MARVDINKAKQKAQEEAEKAAARGSWGGTVIYWKPKQGKNKIRVMPPWTDDPSNPNANQFWREIYVHFSVGDNNSTFACPTKTEGGPGAECPICDEVNRLKATKDPADAEVAKDIIGKQRLYSNIVDLEDAVYTPEDVAEWKKNEYNQGKDCPFKAGWTKVQVFGYGPMIFKQLLDIFTENVDITDLNAGYDISITRSGKDRQTEYNVQILPPAKPFQMVGWGAVDDALVNMDTILEYKPVSDMYAALTGAPPPPQVGAGSVQPQAALPPARTAPTPTQRAVPPELPEDEPAQMAVPQSEEPAPECFKDPETFNATDQECVGGAKDIDGEMMEFECCPYFDLCQEAVTEILKPKKTQTRRRATKTAAASAAPPPTSAEVDDLEAEMRKAIS